MNPSRNFPVIVDIWKGRNNMMSVLSTVIVFWKGIKFRCVNFLGEIVRRERSVTNRINDNVENAEVC